MNILKPLKRGNVMTEEEVLKELENVPDSNNAPEEVDVASPDDPGETFHALGIDYGLIFASNGRIFTSRDGQEVKEIRRKAGGGILYQNKNLHHSSGNEVVQWPDGNTYTFEDEVTGINQYHGRIFITLPGKICNLQGRTIAEAERAKQATFYCGDLWYISKGKLHTKHFTRKTWMPEMDTHHEKVLAEFEDSLYTSCSQQVLDRYQPSGVQHRLSGKFPYNPHCIRGMRDRDGVKIFLGTEFGIKSINIEKPEDICNYCSGWSHIVTSITFAPIDFIKRLNAGSKWKY